MSNAGIPLRIVQEVSGHRNLSQLQKYLEVKPEQVRGAIASLAMISPVGKSIPTAGETDGKVEKPDRGYAKNHLLRALKST
jgi:integrase/recombinase XerD